jgi:hypothetical protein
MAVLVSPAPTHAQYKSAAQNFPNPERGFYYQDAPMWFGTQMTPQTVSSMINLRNRGITVLRWYFLIDEFVAADFDETTLNFIDSQFDTAREAGMKVIPRFSYNFPDGDDEYPYTDPDATLPQMLEHISQLEPILTANADVIAFMELGFVGAWGEWHSSTNGHVDEETGINDNSRAIVAAILDALPAERMVAMRYAPYKRQLYGEAALTSEQAFSQTPQARMGAHNDCFLASNTDWGTYPVNAQARAAIKQYLSTDNQYLPQGGETCNFGQDAQPYITCSNALSDLTLLRFSVLNDGYQQQVLQYWKDNGCYNTIAKRLGYRLEIVDVPVANTAEANEVAQLTLIIKNTGFAAPYNPRGFEIILRSHADNTLYRPTLLTTPDPRRWLPDLGKITLNLALQLPADIPAGGYDVLLNLPDPAPTLYGRPEYSIRMATQGVWEADTGFNDLLVDMTVFARVEGETSDVLTNGGFEDGLTAWSVKRPAGKPNNDKVVCGGMGAIGTDCAFLFKGGAGENTSLTQTVTLTDGQIVASDVLSVILRYSSTRASNALSVKVTAKPTGGTVETVVALPAAHFTRTTLNTTPNYGLRLGVLPASLNDSALSSLKLHIRFKSPAGKLYLDDVRLTITNPSTRGMLPLPSTP